MLDRLDRRALGILGVTGYVRYMDDFVLFAHSKDALRAAHMEVERFLATELDLRLKERSTILAPARQGLPFLGWRIHPGTTRVRPANLRRLRARLGLRARESDAGRIDAERLGQAVRSTLEHLRQGSTRSLVRGWTEELERLLQPRGPAREASQRVNRGGSFNNTAVNARSAKRNDNTPSNADDNLGLRPAKAPHRPISAEIPPQASGAPARRARDAQAGLPRRKRSGRRARGPRRRGAGAVLPLSGSRIR